MTAIRQSTARTVLVGPILDADGVAKTDEVVANIRMTKNGTVGSADGSTTLTHNHAGKYKLAMAVDDPDTVGLLEVSLDSGTNDMSVVRFNVVVEAVWDAMYAASAAGPLQSATAGRKLAVSANGEGSADLTFIHGSALTETSGQLAARFVNFFDQDSAGYNVKTPLASFKATGFSTHDAAAVWSAGGRSLSTPGDYKADVATLETRLSAARAAKLDNIPAGTMPTQAEVLAIQNNTRVRVIVPPAIERPDSGSTTYRLWLYLYDTAGNMEAPDSLPTVAAENNTGTDRSAGLSAVTNDSTGVYRVDYTVADDHAIEGLRFEWTTVEGGVTRKHGAGALVVDTTAVDFTAADRTLLEDVPTTAEFIARTLAAAAYFDPANDAVTTDAASRTASKATGFSTHDAAAVKTALEANGSKLDHVWETTEDDVGVRRFTTNALEQAPSGSGGDATEAKQDTMIATLATVAPQGDDSDTLETLSDQLDGLKALSGEGAFTGTLTIDDGSTVLEGAVVNARRGGVLKASGITDASGEITNWVFGAFTYDLAARLDGYEPDTDTITVSANGWSKTISLTANTISAPPNASTTTGVTKTYDEEQALEAGVKVSVQIIEGPAIAGLAYDSAVWTETSDGSGVVQFAGIVHGAQYKIWRGDSKANAQTFTAPTTGTSFDLPEVIGRG